MIVDSWSSHPQVKNTGNLLSREKYFHGIITERKDELAFEYGSIPNDVEFKLVFVD